MPRPLISSQDLRHRFDLYLASHEVEQLRELARVARLPMSTYLRRLALRQSIQMPPTEFAVAQWRELGRLANNINQLARLAHAGQLPQETDAALAEVAQLLRQLRIDVLAITPRSVSTNPGKKP